MVQNQTTIKSGNNTIKTYDLDGVLTPASGLREWIFFNAMVNPSNVDNFEVELKPLPFPIYLDSITVYFDASPNDAKPLYISHNYPFLHHAEITTKEFHWQYWTKFNHPVRPEDKLIFNSGAPLGAKINYIELRGYRIALETIETNFGDV